MQYVSTRGEAPVLSDFPTRFWPALPATAGSIVPKEWPQFSAGRNPRHARPALSRSGRSHPDAISRRRDRRRRSSSSWFGRPTRPSAMPRSARWCRPAPNNFVLELFHGPTLAFKDVAMQLLARLMDHVLAERGQRATIVGATSGDTGGAAIDAFAGRDRTDIFILFPARQGLAGAAAPDDDVARRRTSMRWPSRAISTTARPWSRTCSTTTPSATGWRCRASTRSTGRASWPRSSTIFSSALSLGAPDRPVSFTVPTGNFGDIFAGYAAKRMGLPIDRLVIATNDNDILARTLADRRLRDATASSRPPRRRWTSRSRPISSGCCSRPATATHRPSGATWPA